MIAAIADWGAILFTVGLIYLRWRFGPFTAHALWLYRWNRRRLMARMRRQARARRLLYPDPEGIYDNLPPSPGSRRYAYANRQEWLS